MIVFHAIWTAGKLHVWGERRSSTVADLLPNASAQRSGARSVLEVVPPDELRTTMGDLWDPLLTAGATESTLTLRVPHADGVALSSAIGAEPPLTTQLPTAPKNIIDLRGLTIPTLAFGPADAVDALTSWPSFERGDVQRGASFWYWARVAELVLELLAKQQVVPTIHRQPAGTHRGYWRVVVNDENTSERIRRLVQSMPPACRATGAKDAVVQGAALIEQFLWMTVDALVRRCLEQDELAHALHEKPARECTSEMLWLRSLVGADPNVHADGAVSEAAYQTVQQWVSKLEPRKPDRGFRTCVRLEAPTPTSDGADDSTPRSWRLTLHVQAIQNERLIIDAAALTDDVSVDPSVLRRPFENALEHLRADMVRAARHFPPLAPCAEPGGPLGVEISLADAHRFLRDALPMLDLDGLGVFVPTWWREKRPRLRMRFHVGPREGASQVAPPTMRLDSIVEYNWRVALGDEEVTEDELRQLVASTEPLVQLRGRWTEVQRCDIDAALRFLEREASGDTTVLDALRRYYSVDDAETGLPVADFRAHGWVERLLNAQDLDERVQIVEPPVGFVGTLRPYQLKGLSWLSFLTKHGLGACLADDMGLGKTIQLIALLLHERADGANVGPTLLIVPMSVVGNWQRELAKFGPSLKTLVHHGVERMTGSRFVEEVGGYDVVISTYGLAHRDREHLSEVYWRRIALDEAQNIKNAAAKQALAVRSFRAYQRVALTGTPVENRLSELWSILDFLNTGYLGTAAEFRRRFAVPIERNHDDDRAERLRHLIRPFVLRRTKGDPNVEVDLPPKMEMKVLCNLTREQAALYQAVVDDMLGQIDRTGGIQRRGLILAALVKLKQVCNHPAHFLRDGAVSAARSGKCDRLVNMLEEVVAEGDRALVFTQFREMGEILKRVLQETLDRQVLFMHGGSTQKQREEMVDCFQRGTAEFPVFLLSLRAGGVGLNLTAANHVFHYDRWWNPAVEDQATDRAYRIGQDKKVQVHKYMCIGTLEERIDAMIEHKRSLATNVVGGGEEWLTELSTDALRELFTLSRDAVADE